MECVDFDDYQLSIYLGESRAESRTESRAESVLAIQPSASDSPSVSRYSLGLLRSL